MRSLWEINESTDIKQLVQSRGQWMLAMIMVPVVWQTLQIETGFQRQLDLLCNSQYQMKSKFVLFPEAALRLNAITWKLWTPLLWLPLLQIVLKTNLEKRFSVQKICTLIMSIVLVRSSGVIVGGQFPLFYWRHQQKIFFLYDSKCLRYSWNLHLKPALTASSSHTHTLKIRAYILLFWYINAMKFYVANSAG